VNETISSLNVNGAPMPRGTYGSGESTAEYTDDRLFAGQGIMTVVSGPVPAGKINNGEGADAVTVTTARLTGEMIVTRERPVTVTIYWGQRDGRNKKDDWQHSLSLGIREPGTFETILSNLNPRTEYYYRSALKNSKGTAWAGRSESFKTYGKPEIATTRPVIMREGTRLRGMLADTNGAPTVTWVYYGLSDGKKDVKAWDNSYCFGNTGNGALETNLSDLKPHTGYYCRFFATNRYGSSWADSSLSWNTAGEPGRNDITFFCISDIHFGMSPAVNAFNPSVVDMMNSAPGEHWPEKVGGGSIEPPRAIVIPGDTTCSATKEEWGMFTNYYGLVGENRLAYQVYEGWGNHDGGDWLIGEIKERNTRRPGLTAISPNGLHYSWDWDDVHCIQLNIAAGDDWHPYNPRYSYTFLTNDLATQVGNSGRPVLLFQHFSIKKHGAIDYAPEAQTNFYNAIAPYNVIGLFHGHVHDSGHYTWRGIDVFNTTHMHGESDGKPPAHGFLAVNITPKGMRVVEHKSDGKVGFTFSKPIPFLEKRKGQ